jgi:hypothetical protein
MPDNRMPKDDDLVMHVSHPPIGEIPEKYFAGCKTKAERSAFISGWVASRVDLSKSKLIPWKDRFLYEDLWKQPDHTP